MNLYEIDIKVQTALDEVTVNQLVKRLLANHVTLCEALPAGSLGDGDVLHFRLNSQDGITEVTRFVRELAHRAAPDVFVETRRVWA